MSTLEPGVHDHEEAPWWEFSCDEVIVVKQWMGEAARVFAQAWGAGPEVDVECDGMNLDGTVGHYTVVNTHFPISFTVTRGQQVPKPQT